MYHSRATTHPFWCFSIWENQLLNESLQISHHFYSKRNFIYENYALNICRDLKRTQLVRFTIWNMKYNFQVQVRLLFEFIYRLTKIHFDTLTSSPWSESLWRFFPIQNLDKWITKKSILQELSLEEKYTNRYCVSKNDSDDCTYTVISKSISSRWNPLRFLHSVFYK